MAEVIFGSLPAWASGDGYEGGGGYGDGYGYGYGVGGGFGDGDGHGNGYDAKNLTGEK